MDLPVCYLQYYEDDMVARKVPFMVERLEHPLHHGACQPGPPGTLPGKWKVHNIIGKTPWLAARDHLGEDEVHRYYQEPDPGTPSELEWVTEDVYHLGVEAAAQRESGDQPIPLLHADKVQTQNPLGPQLSQC